ACSHGGITMFALVHNHLLDNGTASVVLWRQFFQMVFQVLTHLLFSFTHKTETPAVTHQAGYSAQAKRHGIKRRIQHAGTAVEFFEAVFTPGQMVNFLGCSLVHGIAYI